MYKKVEKDKLIVKENREAKYIYLIKSGKFDVCRLMSIFELNDLINHYREKIDLNALQSEYEELRFSNQKLK